ncbi:MAG: hypothetical protein NTY66_01505 [Candidatus Vogelbacteria bacterium]|nr:hypothetical protein [Candidatus Vogelbacteria bacterium]
MSPPTLEWLKTFASQASWREIGHPGDLDRFQDFVIFAYRHGDQSISLEEFLSIVKNANVGETDLPVKKRVLASKMFMFSKYEEEIKLLNKFESS